MSTVRPAQRWIPLAGLGLILVIALAIGTTGHSRSSVDDRVHRVTAQIKCPICSGETVADSSAPISQDIRAAVRQLLLAGRSDRQIIAYIEQQYPGTSLTPASTGLGLLAWALPVVVFVAAAGGLGLTFARWRSGTGATPSDEDRNIVDKARRDADD